MKVFFIAAALAASTVAVDDKEAYELLDEQIGIYTYNTVCGGDDFAVPKHADKVVTDAQRTAYYKSGAFDAAINRWYGFIRDNGCQTAAKHWTYRGAI